MFSYFSIENQTNDPSLADVIKMTHPAPADASRAALYGYITGREAASFGKPLVEEKLNKKGKVVVIRRYNSENLPDCIKQYENFKKNPTGKVPNVEFRLLTSLNLTKDQWVQIAKNAPWHMVRMNLNTFQRHGVFDVPGMDTLIAEKLSNPETISKVKVFPYQLLAAYHAASSTGVPVAVTNALQDAMELATANIPTIEGKVYVFTDVSGSMRSSPVTGQRDVATKIMAVNAAALISASILRKNPTAEVIPFSDTISTVRLNPRDSIMTNTNILSKIPSGGTNCSAPLAHLNKHNAKGDLCIMLSDNESNLDSKGYGHGPCAHQYGTQMLDEWNRFKTRNPSAKLVCLDLTPNATIQTINRSDILNLGGFSDSSWEVIAKFAQGGLGQHWVDVIESTKID
jgi:60 kDa SS-A/Ro ribonucleoprotein